MKHYTIFITLFLVSINFVFTQTKTFIREYTYNAGEADSKLSSRALALTQVKKILLEEIGVYLESTFETKKEEKQFAGQITLDELTTQQVTMIAAGVTNTKILEEKWDGETYYIKAEITVDVDDVAKKLKNVANDKEKIKELEDLRKRVDNANNEIEKLRRELANTETEKEKTEKIRFYNKNINTLTADEWFTKGYDAAISKDYENAIDYYTKVIEFNPKHDIAYNNRGITKSDLKDYHGAINDYNKAIELNPQYADAYNNRGSAKGKLEDYRGAITDFTKVIELDPQHENAYMTRGVVKFNLKDYRGAIADFTKAIEINPQYVYAYYNRGLTKYDLGDKNGACLDWSKAGELGYMQAYDWIKKHCK